MSSLYELTAVLEMLGFALQGKILHLIFQKGLFDLCIAMMSIFYLYFLFFGILTSNYEKVFVALIFVLVASLFKIPEHNAGSTFVRTHGIQDGFVENYGDYALNLDAFSQEQDPPSHLMVKGIELSSRLINYFEITLMDIFEYKNGRSLFLETGMIDTFGKHSTQQSIFFRDSYKKQCFLDHFKNFEGIFLKAIKEGNATSLDYNRMGRVSQISYESQGYFCFNYDLNASNQIECNNGDGYFYYDLSPDDIAIVNEILRGWKTKVVKGSKPTEVSFEHSDAIPVETPVYYTCYELRDLALNETKEGLKNNEAYKKAKEAKGLAIYAFMGAISKITAEETANFSNNNLGTLGIGIKKTFEWIASKIGAFGQDVEVYNVLSLAPLVQGLLLMVIYTMMGFAPLVLLVKRNFDYLLQCLLWTVWVKSWSIIWILISAIAKSLLFLSDEGIRLGYFEDSPSLELFEEIAFKSSSINNTMGLAMLAVPFVTSMFFASKFSNAISTVKAGG